MSRSSVTVDLGLKNIDDAQQAAADIAVDEQWLFVRSIILAAWCKEHGQGALDAVAPYRKWSAQTLNRLAALKPVLEQAPEIINPMVPLGCYWHLLKACTDDDGFDLADFEYWADRCADEQLSLGQLKELRGEKPERQEPEEAWFEGEGWGMRGGGGFVHLKTKKPPDRSPWWRRLHIRAVALKEAEDG